MRIQVSGSVLLNSFTCLKNKSTPQKATLHLIIFKRGIYICTVHTALELFLLNFGVQIYRGTRVVFQRQAHVSSSREVSPAFCNKW